MSSRVSAGQAVSVARRPQTVETAELRHASLAFTPLSRRGIPPPRSLEVIDNEADKNCSFLRYPYRYPHEKWDSHPDCHRTASTLLSPLCTIPIKTRQKKSRALYLPPVARFQQHRSGTVAAGSEAELSRFRGFEHRKAATSTNTDTRPP